MIIRSQVGDIIRAALKTQDKQLSEGGGGVWAETTVRRSIAKIGARVAVKTCIFGRG
jgi:hypothetical protein